MSGLPVELGGVLATALVLLCFWAVLGLEEHSPREITHVYRVHRLLGGIPKYFKGALGFWGAAGFFCGWLLLIANDYLPARNTGELIFSAAVGLVIAINVGQALRTIVGGIVVRLMPKLMQLHDKWLSQNSIAKGYRLPEKPVFDTPAIVLGESHCNREYQADGSYQLTYHTEDKLSPVPEWAVISTKSAVTGLLILGSTGSGKTSAVIKPSVFQMFHHSSRPGGLIMDSKASLVDPLKDCLKAAGRDADYVALGPDAPYKWNPFHAPEFEPEVVAEQVVTAIENVNGSPYTSESRWIRQGVSNLFEAALGLLRERAGYVTAEAITEFLSLCKQGVANADNPGEVIAQTVNDLFVGVELTGDKKRHVAYYTRLLADRFSEDQKFVSIYTAELGQFLLAFVRPSVSHLFNAPEEELNFPSWREAIERGMVVCLDCNSSTNQVLSIALGMLLKLSYQQALLARIDWMRKEGTNADRYMLLVIDEAQDYVSPGDVVFQAKCRESLSIGIYATQGLASIEQQLGKERTDTLIQSFRNRLILTQSLPDKAADMLGQALFSDAKFSISENVQHASLQAGKFAGDSTVSESVSEDRTRRHIVAPEILQSLPMAQAILQSHDGSRHIPTHRVYLRIDPHKRHADHDFRGTR